jgi:hypothetical protein
MGEWAERDSHTSEVHREKPGVLDSVAYSMAYGAHCTRLGAFLRWWVSLDKGTRWAMLQVMMAASWRTQER